MKIIKKGNQTIMVDCIPNTMCGIMSLERWYPMSVVISICGSNFAMIGADRRQVNLKSNGDVLGVVSDDFHKVFRLTDNILFGCSGMYNLDEDLLDPFKVLTHPKLMTMRTAAKAVIQYVDGLPVGARTLCRHYTLCGRDNKGRFCVCTISSQNNFEPQWIVLEDGQFYVQVMGLYGRIEDDPLVNKHIVQTQPWGTNTVLKQHLNECLTEYTLADKTGTIGGIPEILTIT